jgi:hypothetical protein
MASDILSQFPALANLSDFVEIPIAKKNVSTIVSIVDADFLRLRWFLNKDGYAARQIKSSTTKSKTTTLLLSRAVLERMLGRTLEKGEQVDHIDNNPLNNLRSNIRLVTIKENSLNRRRRTTNKCGYKGVHAANGRWRAVLNKKHIGYYSTPEAAYEAWCIAAKEAYGEYFNPG